MKNTFLSIHINIYQKIYLLSPHYFAYGHSKKILVLPGSDHTAAIVLAYVLYMGPYNRISERRTITYGYPTGPKFEDIKPGDKLELNYESNKPINIILLRTKDSGEYFNNPASTVKPIVLATDSTGGYIEHTFETSGTWGVYFENPNPPPRAPAYILRIPIHHQGLHLLLNIGVS
jgi:hypothetical protein